MEGFFISSLWDDRSVAAWPSRDTNGAQNGIFGQMLNADGTEDWSMSFKSTTYTCGDQSGSTGFVTAWSARSTPFRGRLDLICASWRRGRNSGQDIRRKRVAWPGSEFLVNDSALSWGSKIGAEFHVAQRVKEIDWTDRLLIHIGPSVSAWMATETVIVTWPVNVFF